MLIAAPVTRSRVARVLARVAASRALSLALPACQGRAPLGRSTADGPAKGLATTGRGTGARWGEVGPKARKRSSRGGAGLGTGVATGEAILGEGSAVSSASTSKAIGASGASALGGGAVVGMGAGLAAATDARSLGTAGAEATGASATGFAAIGATASPTPCSATTGRGCAIMAAGGEGASPCGAGAGGVACGSEFSARPVCGVAACWGAIGCATGSRATGSGAAGSGALGAATTGSAITDVGAGPSRPTTRTGSASRSTVSSLANSDCDRVEVPKNGSPANVPSSGTATKDTGLNRWLRAKVSASSSVSFARTATCRPASASLQSKANSSSG